MDKMDKLLALLSDPQFMFAWFVLLAVIAYFCTRVNEWRQKRKNGLKR